MMLSVYTAHPGASMTSTLHSTELYPGDVEYSPFSSVSDKSEYFEDASEGTGGLYNLYQRTEERKLRRRANHRYTASTHHAQFHQDTIENRSHSRCKTLTSLSISGLAISVNTQDSQSCINCDSTLIDEPVQCCVGDTAGTPPAFLSQPPTIFDFYPSDHDDAASSTSRSTVRQLSQALYTHLARPIASRSHTNYMDVPGAQHFIVRQHTQFPDVTEVFDCDDLSVVYRKVSHTDKQWLDTFHDVAVEDEDNGWPASSQSSSITATHLFPARTVSYEGSIVSQDSMGGGSPAPSISGCYSGVPSVAGSNVASTMRSISCSPSLGSSIGSSVRSSWRRRCYPASYDQNPLWEISTPYPNRFPLHCRDARGVIDPVPLTLMVLDRHKFCYRFQLAGTKMRWVAKRLSNQQTELQCYVRNTIVAVMLFDCEWAAGEPQSRHLLPGELPLLKCQNVGPRGGCTPRIVIFPAAFQKLAKVEPGVVESFIVFSGIEVFECLFIL